MGRYRGALPPPQATLLHSLDFSCRAWTGWTLPQFVPVALFPSPPGDQGPVYFKDAEEPPNIKREPSFPADVAVHREEGACN
jgi:hypothetical protein